MRCLGLIRKPVPASAPRLDGHAIKAMRAPPRLMRSHVPFTPQMFGNDVVGNCTWAGVGNGILGQAALLPQPWVPDMPDQSAVTMYERFPGYNPADPATDKGANEVDVLAYQAAHGYDAGGEAPYVGLWATTAPDDLNTHRLLMARLGVCYYAVNLAEADEAADGVWDTTTPGDQTAGSWGPHALVGWDYTGTEDTDVVRLATWGGFQSVTWRWMRSRVIEAHSLVHPEICGMDRLTFAGIDRDRLAADMAAMLSA